MLLGERDGNNKANCLSIEVMLEAAVCGGSLIVVALERVRLVSADDKMLFSNAAASWSVLVDCCSDIIAKGNLSLNFHSSLVRYP